MELELEIYFHTDETADILEETGEFPLHKCDVRLMTFYSIDCVAPFVENEVEYAKVFSGSNSFISVLTYEEVKQKISEAKKRQQ